jgi:hypothetical protein
MLSQYDIAVPIMIRHEHKTIIKTIQSYSEIVDSDLIYKKYLH